jgi:hypothetical protein
MFAAATVTDSGEKLLSGCAEILAVRLVGFVV